MKTVVTWVCADCLRSLEVLASDDARRRTACCTYCGGPLVPHGDSDDEHGTPLSLVLTPDDGDWSDDPRQEHSEAPPKVVGRFQVRERLGGGGFGEVYRAYDPRLDREVAIKVLRESHPGARVMERFFREARAAARMDHPHIVPLYDAGRDDGRCWIAFRFIPGKSLEMKRGACRSRFDTRDTVRIVRDLAEALDHAHRRGIVHRDVKPSNVIIDENGEAFLTDFGLARRLDHEPTLTVEGAVLGTPSYMSPEQAAGRSHMADARSDIFSLGVLFFELLAGERPRNIPSGIPAWRAESTEPFLSVRKLNAHVPRTLDRICATALSRDPASRYCDARAMAADLDCWLRRRGVNWQRWTALGIVVAAAGLGLSHLSGGIAGMNGPVVGASVLTAQGPPQMLRLPRQLASALFVRDEKSLIFHTMQCPVASAIKVERRRVMSASQARSLNLRACLQCQPGGPVKPQVTAGATPPESPGI